MRLGARLDVRLASAAVAAAAGFALMVVGARPAAATFDTNAVGCSGHATFTPKGGAPLTIDASQAKATVPREAGPVAYEGAVSTVTHDHAGTVRVLLGPFGMDIYDWHSTNADNKPSSTGTRDYPKTLKNVPPGIYRVEGSHHGREGGCTGHMDIEIAGSPISSPAGAGSLAAVVLSGIGLIAAGRSKATGTWKGHPILGVVAGLLLGLFAAAGATFWKLAPLTTPVLAVAVLAGLALGLVWSAVAPLGGAGAAAAADGV